jgi:hypothetical protein
MFYVWQAELVETRNPVAEAALPFAHLDFTRNEDLLETRRLPGRLR